MDTGSAKIESLIPGEEQTLQLAQEDSPWRRIWRYGRALVAPMVIWGFLIAALVQLGLGWTISEERYDEAAVQEWIEEARNADSTLADLVEEYQQRVRLALELAARLAEARGNNDPKEGNLLLREIGERGRVAIKREEIYQHIRSLAEPPTKMYPGLLPLFPIVYRLEVHFDGLVSLSSGSSFDDPVIWESGLEPSSGQYRESIISLGSDSRVLVRYQLRAWNKRQSNEQVKTQRIRILGLLALVGTMLGLAWFMMMQADEREHEKQRRLARERIDQAERQRLEEERKRTATERELLEQRLATQAAERKALELKSHLYASIGIMAGSYAHNIKNLLVRPNDLLRRCLERPDTPTDQERMLREVQHTLGMVTERLQQILHTVRRDPSRSQLQILDLNVLIRGLAGTWKDLAADRWQLDLEAHLDEQSLPVEGDDSHLQQAVENLLFNARDATFEMRNIHRDSARRSEHLDPAARRQAVIAAASWRGKVMIRTRREVKGSSTEYILEVSDNGAGMSEEVLKRCTETHFSTKRDNALYEGHSTGMGLGLSFVLAILENHHAQLEIESRPQQGTTFRARFPKAP